MPTGWLLSHDERKKNFKYIYFETKFRVSPYLWQL